MIEICSKPTLFCVLTEPDSCVVLNLWTRETFNDEPFIVTPELFNKPYGVPDSVERANLSIVAVFVTVETTDLDRPI